MYFTVPKKDLDLGWCGVQRCSRMVNYMETYLEWYGVTGVVSEIRVEKRVV